MFANRPFLVIGEGVIFRASGPINIIIPPVNRTVNKIFAGVPVAIKWIFP